MYIDHSAMLVIALLLWWHYCWVPAREQWKQDRARRKQAKYETRMRKIHGQWPLPEPYEPGWYEWLYKDDPASMIAHKYWQHVNARKRSDPSPMTKLVNLYWLAEKEGFRDPGPFPRLSPPISYPQNGDS